MSLVISSLKVSLLHKIGESPHVLHILRLPEHPLPYDLGQYDANIARAPTPRHSLGRGGSTMLCHGRNATFQYAHWPLGQPHGIR